MSSARDNLSALCENLAKANGTWGAGTWTLHLKDIHVQLVSQFLEDWMQNSCRKSRITIATSVELVLPLFDTAQVYIMRILPFSDTSRV